MSATGQTLLNVDDNEAVRYAKSRTLRAAGYEVLEAGTGAEALRLVREAAPTLVLLDVKLPDMSGIEVCRRIKQHNVGVLVLQTSASFVTSSDRIRGLESGADSYLTEPVEPPELVAAVRALLRLHQTERALRESEARLRLAIDAARLSTWEFDVAQQTGARQGELTRTLPQVPDSGFTLAAWLREIHPADRARVEALFNRLLNGEEERVAAEFRVRRPGESAGGEDGWAWIASSGAVVERDSASNCPRRIAGVAQDISERRRAGERQAMILSELNHRVKNILATVQGLAAQTLKGSGGDAQRFAEQFGARLRTLARAHDLLTARGWQPTSIEEAVRAALAPWLQPSGRAKTMLIGGDACRQTVSPQQAQALVLAFHELATNATKYGAFSVPEGQVALSCDAGEALAVTLRWSETGGPPVMQPPARRGFGTRLLERGLARDLGAGSQVLLDFQPAGLRASIRFTPNEPAFAANDPAWRRPDSRPVA